MPSIEGEMKKLDRREELDGQIKDLEGQLGAIRERLNVGRQKDAEIAKDEKPQKFLRSLVADENKHVFGDVLIEKKLEDQLARLRKERNVMDEK